MTKKLHHRMRGRVGSYKRMCFEGNRLCKEAASIAAQAAREEDPDNMLTALDCTWCEDLPQLVHEDQLVGSGGVATVHALPKDAHFPCLQGAKGVIKMMPLSERDLVNGKAAASCLGDLVMTALKRRGKIGSRAAALRWYCEPRTDLIVDGKPTCGLMLYLLMERYTCTLLDYLLARVHKTGDTARRQVKVEPLLAAVIQILKQVSELHALNLTHGDIKLTNILVKVCPVTGDLTDVQLADFGSVTYMAGAAAKYIMVTTIAPYMRNGETVTCKGADIYNVGRILMQCLFGPGVLPPMGNDVLASLTNLTWVAQCTLDDLHKAALDMHMVKGSRKTSHKGWGALDSSVLRAGRVLACEMGVGFTGDEGCLMARRLASLLAPGAQTQAVAAAVTSVLPLCYSMTTTAGHQLRAEGVADAVQGVVSRLQQSPPTDRDLLLSPSLFPTNEDQLMGMWASIPYDMDIVTPELVKDKVRDQQQQQLRQGGGHQGVKRRWPGPHQQGQQQRKKRSQQQQGQQHQEGQQQEEVRGQGQQQAERPLSYDDKVLLFRQAGWVVRGHSVYGPAGQTRLITEPLPQEVYLAAPSQ